MSQGPGSHAQQVFHQTSPPGLCAFQEPRCWRWPENSVPTDQAGAGLGGAGLSPGSGALSPVPTSPQAAITATPPRPRAEDGLWLTLRGAFQLVKSR